MADPKAFGPENGRSRLGIGRCSVVPASISAAAPIPGVPMRSAGWRWDPGTRPRGRDRSPPKTEYRPHRCRNRRGAAHAHVRLHIRGIGCSGVVVASLCCFAHTPLAGALTRSRSSPAVPPNPRRTWLTPTQIGWTPTSSKTTAKNDSTSSAAYVLVTRRLWVSCLRPFVESAQILGLK